MLYALFQSFHLTPLLQGFLHLPYFAGFVAHRVLSRPLLLKFHPPSPFQGILIPSSYFAGFLPLTSIAGFLHSFLCCRVSWLSPLMQIFDTPSSATESSILLQGPPPPPGCSVLSHPPLLQDFLTPFFFCRVSSLGSFYVAEFPEPPPNSAAGFLTHLICCRVFPLSSLSPFILRPIA